MAMDDVGITYYLDGQVIKDIFGRPNPITWEYLASKNVPKANFMGTAHMRLQLQVGSSYWGPSTAQTAFPATMKVHWVRVLTKT